MSWKCDQSDSLTGALQFCHAYIIDAVVAARITLFLISPLPSRPYPHGDVGETRKWRG